MYRSLTSHVPPPIRGRAQAPSPGSLFRCAGAIPRPRIANPRANQFPPYVMATERERDNPRAQISRRILHGAAKFAYEKIAPAFAAAEVPRKKR